MNTRTEKFRIERYAAYGFILFYVFSSQFLTTVNHDQEVFPFFQWGLHSTVDNVHKFIQVRLTRLQSAAPCLLQNCPNIPARVKSTRFYFLVQDMGRVQNSDPAAFEEMRWQIETILKQSIPQVVRYELIEAVARPQEFSKDGSVSLGRVIYQGLVAP